MSREKRKTGAMSVNVSPDLDAYAAGEIPAHEVRCALCVQKPCKCPPFGSDEHFELINRRHNAVVWNDPDWEE